MNIPFIKVITKINLFIIYYLLYIINYKGLNLFQIIYLHIIKNINPIDYNNDNDLLYRYIVIFIVTSPWLIRNKFPINKFSDNYNKIDKKSSTLIRILYRIKKYQYVFYKHFLLHGLNISMIFNGGNNLVNSQLFRLYWILLNTAYVFEFFLQTLVKKVLILFYIIIIITIIIIIIRNIYYKIE